MPLDLIKKSSQGQYISNCSSAQARKIPAQDFQCQPSSGIHTDLSSSTRSWATFLQVTLPRSLTQQCHFFQWPNRIQMNEWGNYSSDFFFSFQILTYIFSLLSTMGKKIKIKWFGHNADLAEKEHRTHECHLRLNPWRVRWRLWLNPSDKWPELANTHRRACSCSNMLIYTFLRKHHP